jgi:hypothetical protein
MRLFLWNVYASLCPQLQKLRGNSHPPQNPLLQSDMLLFSPHFSFQFLFLKSIKGYFSQVCLLTETFSFLSSVLSKGLRLMTIKLRQELWQSFLLTPVRDKGICLGTQLVGITIAISLEVYMSQNSTFYSYVTFIEGKS